MTAHVETNPEIIGVYEELKGILESVPDQSWFDDEGFTNQVNHIIDRAAAICPEIEDIAVYKIIRDHLNDGRQIVHAIQTKSKLAALTGRIRGTYKLEVSPQNSGHTFIQNQSQSQSLSVALEWQERINAEIPKHAQGSQERTFLEKLKESLPTIKSVTDIISSALKIGADLGLDPATIHKVLGL